MTTNKYLSPQPLINVVLHEKIAKEIKRRLEKDLKKEQKDAKQQRNTDIG